MRLKENELYIKIELFKFLIILIFQSELRMHKKIKHFF